MRCWIGGYDEMHQGDHDGRHEEKRGYLHQHMQTPVEHVRVELLARDAQARNEENKRHGSV